MNQQLEFKPMAEMFNLRGQAVRKIRLGAKPSRFQKLVNWLKRKVKI